MAKLVKYISILVKHIPIILIILILFLMMWTFYFILNSGFRDTSLLIGLMTTNAELLIAYVAWIQLNKIKKANSAEFIHKLKRDFFTKEARNLMTLIELDALKYVNNEKLPYFIVLEERIASLPGEIKKELLNKMLYTAYEIDDILLGHFEDIGIFEENGILDIKMIYEEFSWYIETVYKNYEIQRYLKNERDDDKEIYSKFEHIYYKCKKLEQSK
jgi:hypothetical protein